MDAKKIKKLRKDLNLSQQRFANKLGVGITTVTRWENNKSSPSPLASEKLARLKRRSNKE